MDLGRKDAMTNSSFTHSGQTKYHKISGLISLLITLYKFYSNQHLCWHKQLQVTFVQRRCHDKTGKASTKPRTAEIFVLPSVLLQMQKSIFFPKPRSLSLKREECCSVVSLALGKQSLLSAWKNYPGSYPARAAATPHREGHQGNGLFLQVHGNWSFETQSFLVAWDCLAMRDLATFLTRGWLCEQRGEALRTTVLPEVQQGKVTVLEGQKKTLHFGENKNCMLGLLRPQERACSLNAASSLLAWQEEGKKFKNPPLVHFSSRIREPLRLEGTPRGLQSNLPVKLMHSEVRSLRAFSRQGLKVSQRPASVLIHALWETFFLVNDQNLPCCRFCLLFLTLCLCVSDESQVLMRARFLGTGPPCLFGDTFSFLSSSDSCC